jgi:hypothetical protein
MEDAPYDDIGCSLDVIRETLVDREWMMPVDDVVDALAVAHPTGGVDAFELLACVQRLLDDAVREWTIAIGVALTAAYDASERLERFWASA